MKLISMTEFVLNEKQKFSELGKGNYDNSSLAKSYDIVIRYAEFLRQPLTLGMFVPVNEEGKVLHEITEPNKSDYWSDDDTVFSAELYRNNLDELKKYNNAKEKVLFDGFSLIKSDIETLNHTTFIENEKGEQVGHNKSWEDEWNLYGVSVEDLIGFDLELTPSALKQIQL